MIEPGTDDGELAIEGGDVVAEGAQRREVTGEGEGRAADRSGGHRHEHEAEHEGCDGSDPPGIHGVVNVAEGRIG